MKDSAQDLTVIERLRHALATNSVPTAARDHAAHLLKRLSSPVRVTLLGRPGSGKSELVNMFVRSRILPRDMKLPTLELGYGPSERITVISSDGTKSVIDGLNFGAACQGSPAFLKVEAPLPLLQRVSLLEVVTDGSVSGFQSAIDWAVRRTDIALWCTQDFDLEERAHWARVPDSLKDHGFMVLTKADKLSADKVLSSRIAELETVVSEEFHSLFAVATLQAIKAYRPNGQVDESIYHASGGGALSAQILRHAERGRRADFDSAHLFLAGYQIANVPAKPSANEAEKAEKPNSRPITVPVTSAKPEEPSKVENVALFSDAVRFLRRRGDGLATTVSTLEPGSAGVVVEQCVDAVEHLVDLFSQDDSGCPAADAFIDDLMEATDLMVLMQVETGDAPAADAATLLLQLRHEIEMKLAA